VTHKGTEDEDRYYAHSIDGDTVWVNEMAADNPDIMKILMSRLSDYSEMISNTHWMGFKRRGKARYYDLNRFKQELN
jgi:hypothetical protein